MKLEQLEDPYSGLFKNHLFSDFVAQQSERKLLHVKCPDVIKKVNISVDEICQKIKTSRLLINNLSMSKNEVPIDVYDYSDGTFIEPNKVFESFESGASIIFRAAHLFFPQIKIITEELQKPWACPAQANIYLSKSGVNATFPHFDPHELFIYQIYGSKRWSIFESKFIFPEVGDGYDHNRHGHGEFVEDYIVSSGDVLFLPRGTVHRPVAVENSIHISFGLMPLSYSKLLIKLIEVMSELNVDYRKIALQNYDKSNTVNNSINLLKKAEAFLENGTLASTFMSSVSYFESVSHIDITKNFKNR